MAEQVKAREWEYWPGEDGESFIDKHGNEVLGWHDRTESQDEIALLAEFEAYYRSMASPKRVDVSLTLRPILMREATEVECRINGWEYGTLTRCTTRAKKSWRMWQIEAAPTQQEPN